MFPVSTGGSKPSRRQVTTRQVLINAATISSTVDHPSYGIDDLRYPCPGQSLSAALARDDQKPELTITIAWKERAIRQFTSGLLGVLIPLGAIRRALTVCGYLSRVGSGRRSRVGWCARMRTRSAVHEEHTRGEAHFDRITFPPDLMPFCQAFVDVRSSDRSSNLPSVGSLKMGTLALRCVFSAHGRSYREKPA
jgi:hypothetical protein